MSDRYLLHDRVRDVVEEELGKGATDLDIAEATVGAAVLMIDNLVIDQINTQPAAVQEICREAVRALGKALRALYPDTAEGNGAIVELRVQATGVEPITHTERVGFEIPDDGFALAYQDMVERVVADHLALRPTMDSGDQLTGEDLVESLVELLHDGVNELNAHELVETAVRRLRPGLVG